MSLSKRPCLSAPAFIGAMRITNKIFSQLVCCFILMALDSKGTLAARTFPEDRECELESESESCNKINPRGFMTNTCYIYLAPSSIPNAGYGLFTTKAFKANEEIFGGLSPSVIFLERELHVPEASNFPLRDYLWQAYGAGAYEASTADSWEPTPLGALGNYHTYLVNYAHSGNALRYDDSLANRFVDPEAGAFSYHTSFPMGATRDIEAGEELFADYGESYLDFRSNEDHENVYSLIPRKDDYEQAASIVNTMSALAEVPREAREALQTVVSSLANKRVASLLPNNSSEYMKFDRMTENDIAFDLAWGTVKRRSIDWIFQNGKCIDGLVDVRVSSIPRAGLGAFASQHIAKGEMIIPAPLVHISDMKNLNMYKFTERHETEEHTSRKQESNGKQLLMNYCFGHGQSSVLLCPTTQAVAMNHCSDRIEVKGQCSKSGANAGFRWADDWSPETKEWRSLSFEELAEKSGRGLIMEIYALRDIASGDEIFLDYGEGWEEAWEKHKNTWSPPDKAGTFSSYVPIMQMNRNMTPPQTESQRASHLLPENVNTGCLYEANYEKSYYEYEAGYNRSALSEEALLEHFAADGSHFVWQETHTFPQFWPCSIVSGNKKDGYTVQIFQASWEYDTPWTEKGLPLFLTSFPRESIRFFNKQGFSDQHLPNSFRHYIELPDDIFPDQWKNTGN